MKVGIIGTGVMGRNHLRVVASIPELTLVGAMDISEENLMSACQDYSIEKYLQYEEMTDRVDAVMISTPTESHYVIAKYFLEHGKHILIEKPLTLTVNQADELIVLAQSKRLIIAVGHLERFNPAVQYADQFVNKPLFVEIQRLGPFSTRSLDVDVIMDLMIHDIDILLHWDDSGINTISGVGVPIISNKIDIANVRLEFNSRLVANVTASRVSQKKTRKLRVFQKNQYLSLDYQKQRVKIFQLKNGAIVEQVPVIESIEPLVNLWRNFYRTVNTGKNFNVTAQEARNALEVAERISVCINSHFER